LKQKYNILPHSLSISSLFKTSNINEVKLKLGQGTSFSIVGKQDQTQHMIIGGFDYHHKQASIHLKGKLPLSDSDKPYKLIGSGVFAMNGISGGGSFTITKGIGLNKWGVKFDYIHDTINTTFYLDYKLKDEDSELKWGVGTKQKINKNFSQAMDFTMNKNIPRIRMGYKYKVDETCAFKARSMIEEEKIKIGLALRQKVNDVLTISLSTDLNTKRLLGGHGDEDNHRFRLGFSFFH